MMTKAHVIAYQIVVATLLVLTLGAFQSMTSMWVTDIVTNDGFMSPKSLAVINGQPAMIVPDTTTGNPRYAAFDGSNWNIQVIDSNSILGSNSLQQINGQPAASYLDNPSNANLRYAQFDGANWNIQVIDSNARTNDLIEYNGQPAIAYLATVGGADELRFAQFDGINWNIETVAVVPSIGLRGAGGPSLAVLNGQPAIALGSNGEIRFYSYDGTNWNVEIIDTIPGFHSRLPLAIVRGQPAVLYTSLNSGNQPLEYAQFNGTTWDIVSVPTQEIVTNSINMVEINGQPAFIYVANGSANLRYVQFNGAMWDDELVVSTPQLSLGPSLTALSDGRPAIAYHVSNPTNEVFFATIQTIAPVQITEDDDDDDDNPLPTTTITPPTLTPVPELVGVDVLPETGEPPRWRIMILIIAALTFASIVGWRSYLRISSTLR